MWCARLRARINNVWILARAAAAVGASPAQRRRADAAGGPTPHTPTSGLGEVLGSSTPRRAASPIPGGGGGGGGSVGRPAGARRHGGQHRQSRQRGSSSSGAAPAALATGYSFSHGDQIDHRSQHHAYEVEGGELGLPSSGASALLQELARLKAEPPHTRAVRA
jgi:hypothetical protein